MSDDQQIPNLLMWRELLAALRDIMEITAYCETRRDETIYRIAEEALTKVGTFDA